MPLLEREGASATVAGFAGGLVLLSGIATRPAGGLLAVRARSRALVGVGLAGTAVGAALLALGGPLWLSRGSALGLGLAAGAVRGDLCSRPARLPDAPATAVAFVNACAIVTILVGTPLAGLAFELPSDGRLAFALLAVLSGSALVVLRRSPL